MWHIPSYLLLFNIVCLIVKLNTSTREKNNTNRCIQAVWDSACWGCSRLCVNIQNGFVNSCAAISHVIPSHFVRSHSTCSVLLTLLDHYQDNVLPVIKKKKKFLYTVQIKQFRMSIKKRQWTHWKCFCKCWAVSFHLQHCELQTSTVWSGPLNAEEEIRKDATEERRESE